MSVVYVEVSRQVERSRRLVGMVNPTHIDVSSVWLLAAAAVLPTSLAALGAVLTQLFLYLRIWRGVDGVQPHRVGYTAATLALTCIAVSTVVHGNDHLSGTGLQAAETLAIAILTYRIANRLLILMAVVASSGRPRLARFAGTWGDNALEFSTLVLGAATAVLVVQVPPLALLVLPAVFLLQHRALLKQLVEAATIDTKTELLNAAAWRQLAQRELERAGRQKTATAVLVIDMDHFKRLNDTYGHLAGDEALKAVGEALADELRGYDAVGRFGGEEFVALLPAVDGPTAMGVAERVRERIESVPVRVERRTGGVGTIAVTASVGVAAAHGGVELDDLLRAADGALYAAKAAGRNAVRRAPHQVTTAA